ncbi:hypothetical protein MASR2M12_12920 [Bacteroidales bacterium]
MRFLKFFGGVGLALLIFLLLLALFMKDEAETSQSVLIRTNTQTVFRMVNSLQNWEQWSPFYEGESDLQSVFSGPSRGVGNAHRWQGSANSGEQKIIRSEPYRLIQCGLDMGSFANATDEWRFEDTAGGVKVTWTLRLSHLSYPFHRYFGYFLESTMSPLQKKGLEKLRELAENMPRAADVILVDNAPVLGLSCQAQAPADSMPQAMGQAWKILTNAMKTSRISAEGPPFALIRRDEKAGNTSFRVVFPIAEEAKEQEGISLFRFEGGRMAMSRFYGGHKYLEHVQQDILEYMADFGLQPAGNVFLERYEVGPLDTADSSQWITDVFCPVIQ